MFGFIKKRREKRKAEAFAKAQEEKRLYQERKDMIDSYLGKWKDADFQKRYAQYKEDEQRAYRKNSTCPNCGSTDVVHNIRRGKGELHGEGEFESSGFGTLFYHSSSGYGSAKIDGKYDTLPVNKCNHCGNEWNIAEANIDIGENIFDTYGSKYPTAKGLFYTIEKYLEARFDPYDKTEKFNSLEEKRESIISDRDYATKNYKKVPRYMIEYAIYNVLDKDSYYRDKWGRAFGYFNKGVVDAYSYIFPDNIWEIVKKVVKWEGEYIAKNE